MQARTLFDATYDSGPVGEGASKWATEASAVDEYGGGLKIVSESKQYTSVPYKRTAEMTVVVWARSAKPKWSANGTIASDRGQCGFVLYSEKDSQNVSFYAGNSSGGMFKVDRAVAVDDIEKPHMCAAPRGIPHENASENVTHVADE